MVAFVYYSFFFTCVNNNKKKKRKEIFFQFASPEIQLAQSNLLYKLACGDNEKGLWGG